jgi:hypothetical protein
MSRTLRSQIPVIMPAAPAAPETLDYRFPAGPVTTALDVDQAGCLEPGTEGWWPVEGARAVDIRPGDRVMKGWADDDGIKRHAEFEAVDFAPYGNLMDSCRVRFTTTTGQLASVGMLQPMALLRRGTHRTLAGSVR